MQWNQHVAACLPGALLLFIAGSAQALCPGDCNGNGRVVIDEVVRATAIGLGNQAARICPPADTNGDGSITVDELLGSIKSAAAGCASTVLIHRAAAQMEPAGPLADGNGEAVLPNGRRITPAGVQIPAETLPLNLALTPDGRHLIVTNDGYSDVHQRQFLQVIDTDTLAVDKVEVHHFVGLAVTPTSDRVFVANDAGPTRVEGLHFEGDTLVHDSTPVANLPDVTFPVGLALSPDASHLYGVGLRSNAFLSIDLATGAVHTANVRIGNLPYGVVVAPDGQRAYVSSWGINGGNGDTTIPAPLPPLNPNDQQRSSVAVVDVSNPDAPRLLHYIVVSRGVGSVGPNLGVNNHTIYGGIHPSAMALSPDGTLLYVTATDVDVLAVVDTATASTIAMVPLNVFEAGPVDQQLQGVYPNALTVSADGRRLYVADAGINAVQVVSVDPQARTFTPMGFIPTGWYPSALALSADGTRLYVANGKGASIGPNGGEAFDEENNPTTYIAQLLKGSVSVIDDVTDYDLDAGTAQVTANNGFAPAPVRWVDAEPKPGEVERGTPVPIDFGSGPSDVIKYAVFILKENRTYDQVFGKLPGGNGDPDLAVFGPDVTPNAQALATQFAAGDNFFDDGEVSTPGHEWADQANCNDFTEKMWPSNYDRNLPSTVLEEGQEGFAKGGFFFQAMERQGIPYRVYGETLSLLSHFAAGDNGHGVASIATHLTSAFGSLPSLGDITTIVNGDIESLRSKGVNVDLLKTVVWPNHMLDYPSNILANRTDVERANIFRGELASFAQTGQLPHFIHIWLPNDHTFGASAGSPTVRSAVADNDAGLGMIIDALTHSPFWPQMAIFVTEDDAQDGEDHVSAHRTVGLVISPYVKHGYVSHVHHSNVSMTKTIELLLGATPLSQFDRYATDMRDYFTAVPDLTPYVALPRTFLPETNPLAAQAPNVYLRRAADLSATLNFAVYDEAGDGLSRVIALVRIGENIEQQKAWVPRISVLLLAGLIAGGALVRRRHGAAAQRA